MSDVDKIKDLQAKLDLYERPGAACLYFAINRKMNEIAALLNGVSLKGLDMASKSDATFERVFKLLEKSEGLGAAAKALAETAGIAGENEELETSRKNKPRITPESMADHIGELAGRRQ